jgi:hypothetical protein
MLTHQAQCYASWPQPISHWCIWGLWTQLVQLGGLCAFLFVLTACAADAVPAASSVRAPPPELEGLLALPAASHAYQYVLFKLGPATVTRRSVALACNTAALSFSLLQVHFVPLCVHACVTMHAPSSDVSIPRSPPANNPHRSGEAR